MNHGSDKLLKEGSMRACGQDWMVAFTSIKGHVCAKVSKKGEFLAWELIHAGGAAHQQMRTVRLAHLGAPESEAKCGSSARFLMGYQTKDPTRRMLVELD